MSARRALVWVTHFACGRTPARQRLAYQRKVSAMGDVRFVPIRPGITSYENGSIVVSIAKHCSAPNCADWHLHIHRNGGSAGIDIRRSEAEALRDCLIELTVQDGAE